MTLWRTIDWSHTLLAPLDQQLFRRLSVFAGGCTIEAVQQVCNDDRTPGKSIAHGISALVDGSLLQRQDGDAGHSRYGRLDTVREYALGRFVSGGEAAAVRGLHAAYYLGLAEAAERAWDGPAEWGLLRTLVIERDNLRATLHWAIETRDAELALRLNAALLSFWTFSSSLGQAHAWLEAALAVPRPDQAPKLAAVEAKVLNVAGYVTATSDHAEANAYFARGLALYRELGDSRAIAWSLRGCAFSHMLHDEYDPAAQLLDESLRLCQATGDAWGHAWSLYALAFLKLAAGDLARARADLDDALLQLRRQNIPMGVFRALLALGHTLFEQGDLSGAAARYREALLLSREAPLLTLITKSSQLRRFPVDPQVQFCPNSACPARGQPGRGNITIHSQREQRYRCTVCGRIFSARTGTPFYRQQYGADLVTLVDTLVAHGCPLAAIGVAFGLHPRTVQRWGASAGAHCQAVHAHLVEQPRDLGQVPADELRIKTQAGIAWIAMAVQVVTRLWLGGVVSARRDQALIAALAASIARCAQCAPLLLVVDGLSTYVGAFRRTFRQRVARPRGRPGWTVWPGLVIGQVVKQYAPGGRRWCGTGVVRRVAHGSGAAAAALVRATQGAGVLNTAYIERMNATFRAHLASLGRRSRYLVRRQAPLTAGMYLVGTVYNFCTLHASLPRVDQWGRRQTPAMAAGLTDHCWRVAE